jgi:hypothetical protein
MCECDLISYSEHTNTEPKTATRQDGFMKRFLSVVAVKPPNSGGGYKATPQSCLHTDGI